MRDIYPFRGVYIEGGRKVYSLLSISLLISLLYVRVRAKREEIITYHFGDSPATNFLVDRDYSVYSVKDGEWVKHKYFTIDQIDGQVCR